MANPLLKRSKIGNYGPPKTHIPPNRDSLLELEDPSLMKSIFSQNSELQPQSPILVTYNGSTE